LSSGGTGEEAESSEILEIIESKRIEGEREFKIQRKV